MRSTRDCIWRASRRSANRRSRHSAPAESTREAPLRSFAPCRSLILGVTQRIERAFGAAGIARQAESAPVQDDLVRKENPFLFRNGLHQVLLDVFRIAVLRQVEPLRDPLNMGVDDDA